jgi:asparagine synthase (glutamine-hydrolysing)
VCGICGVVSLSGRLDPAIHCALPAMTAALAHRGPDGQGLFQGPEAVLGHRRLAIIDRAGGAQPIGNEDGTCRVVFNGEIYNHAPLRRLLEQRGHRFRTASDTEVIVHAYEEFGPAAAERLEGMFALALYDDRRRELWIARDRLGKKPLFYAILGGALHFASEIAALAASPRWNDELDPTVVDAYLALGYVPAPRTLLRHVHKLPAGHWLSLRAGRVEVRKYWDIDCFDADARAEPALCEAIGAQIAAATRARLESEVPLGAFLSGGIDSGLVVAAMADAHHTVTTTTVGFDDAAHNELESAAATARRFRTSHHTQVIATDSLEAITSAVDALDEPLADPSVVPTYHVSGVARQFVTVALTGDGGDETFGGYSFRYVPHAIESALRPMAQRVPGRAAVRLLSQAVPRAALANLTRDPADAYFADLCFVKPPTVGLLLGRSGFDPRDTFGYDAITAPYRRCPSRDAVQRAMYADVKGYMCDDVLVKVDRMSMRHSLEIRCPLLDHHLVELAFRIPARLKMSWVESKRLLRRVGAGRLPAEILGKGKRGFSAPAARWLRGTCARVFESDVFDRSAASAGLFDVGRVRAMFDAHRRGDADYASALWAIWILERWRRRCARPETARPGSQAPTVHARIA